MNVLFVDDEKRVLDGIRRAMFDVDPSWKIFFAPSAMSALTLMEQTPIDLIFSDMRMPEHDGAWLLSEVLRRYPETVRYVLSGHADEGAALRAMRVTHKFLRKPCAAADIKAAIADAAATRSVTADSRLRRIVGVVDMLPMLSDSVIELRRLIESDRCSLGAVAAVIERDPALSAKVLQLVNSSFFSRPEPISNVLRAVTVLGIQLVARIALLVGVLPDNLKIPHLDVQRMRQHALQASTLAKLLNPTSDERPSTSALLADIGRLVLAQQPSATAAMLENSETEIANFGCCHAEVGSYLMALWGLPKDLVGAVRSHHDPIDAEAAATGNITAIVALAHLLASNDAVPEPLRKHPVLGPKIAKAITARDSGRMV